jgi:hypothetical protein
LHVLACHGVPTRLDEAGAAVAPRFPIACPQPDLPGVAPIISPWS